MPWIDGRWEGEFSTIAEISERLGEDKVECDCCGSVDVELKVYRLHSPKMIKLAKENDQEPVKILCVLCASTLAGSQWDYHLDLDYQNLDVLKSLSFIGNEIIKEIRKLKS